MREGLVKALELDLVGPWHEHEFADEMLPGWVRPSNWYLTGFLIPADAPPEQSADDDADDEFDEAPESDGEEGDEDRGAAKKGFFPSSMGLSALVDGAATSLSVTVRWGDYEPGEHRSEQREEEDDKPLPVWRRGQRGFHTPFHRLVEELHLIAPVGRGSSRPF